MQARARLKALWYLTFTALGLFHAEVLSWSQPAVLTDPATFALVAPVYGVHYLLFGDLLLRRGRTDWKPVYLLGCLTGMYETFITKVYWSPPWNPTAPTLGGVAWIELLWIGFTWHAFMSFLIPLRLLQELGSPGTASRRERWALLVVPPLLGGTLGLAFGPPLPEMALSVALSFAVLLGTASAFLIVARRWGLRDLRSLALGRRGKRFAWGALVAVYVGYGALLRPEFLPWGLSLVPILGVYAGLLLLTGGVLRRDRGEEGALPVRPAVGTGLRPLLLSLGAFAAVFSVLGLLHMVLPGLFYPLALGLVVTSVGLPMVLLARVALGLVRTPPKRHPPRPAPGFGGPRA